MRIKILLQILLALSVSESAKLKDYCKYSQENIPCKYKCKRAPLCGKTGDKYRALTASERETVARTHNQYRQIIARGDFSNISLPAAANMNALSYDKECEFFSGCYIKQCMMEHDDAFTAEGEGLGQSLYTMMVHSAMPMDDNILIRGMRSWFREVGKVTPDEAKQMVSDFEMRFETGHFAMMVWAKIKYVGCAMMHNMRDPPFHTYDVFCHYRPSGVMPHMKMYEPGSPKCKANRDYPNLCGRIRPLAEDTYVFPVELGGEERVQKSGCLSTTGIAKGWNMQKILLLLSVVATKLINVINFH